MAKICLVCSKTESFYKCPVCKEPYCSAACFKVHKTTNCEPKAQNEVGEDKKVNNVTYDFPTEDTVAIEKLELLQHSKELKDCLKNPHIRDIMQAILTSGNPTKAIALAMTEPIFVEMADACLKVLEPSVDEEPC